MGGRGWALKKVAPTQGFFFQHIPACQLTDFTNHMWIPTELMERNDSLQKAINI